MYYKLTTKCMIKIFIVDDHEIIRDGLKKVLNEESDLVVTGEARNGDDVLQNIQDIDCDVMLLDLNIPGRSGLDLIADLKKLKLHMRILVLSIHPEDNFALRTLKAGASGYVCKDAALLELVDAIRKVNLKGRYLSTTLAEQLAFEYMPNESGKLLHESLSNREQEIMYLIASGKKVKDIAVNLKLSASTIFNYRMSVLKKLRIESDIELIHYAIVNKIVE